MNQVIRHYHQHKNRTLTPPQMVGEIFIKCSHFVENMEENIRKKDYFSRFQNSEKVITTLTNILGTFDEANPETSGFKEDLKGFCMLILSFITDINRHEDSILCKKTAHLLKDMGEIWKNVG